METEDTAAHVAGCVLSSFRVALKKPEVYLAPNPYLRDDTLEAVKLLYRCVKRTAGRLPVGPLHELYVLDFDEDQIWEELQLTNEPALHSLQRQVMRFGNSVCLLTTETREIQDEVEDSCVDEEVKDEEEEVKSEEDKENEEQSKRRSRVDDDFFSLAAMEQYLKEADQLGDQDSEDNIGILAEDSGDSVNHPVYQDFFPSPQRNEGSSGLSSYEKKKRKMAEEIRAIEESNMASRTWQMSGETGSGDRPLNSLLEEDVDFEPMTLPAPVVSEETTTSIEDIIKQRILDLVWDDVVRKVKPPEKPYDYQRGRSFNQEKNKKSLAEVYEEDYLQQTQQSSEVVEEQDVEHTEIEKLKNTLFLKLDSLTNFYFTPKQPRVEPHIVSNVSSITMEESIPSAMANHSLLAPEEVEAKPHVPVKGRTEQSSADRRRQRLAKKWHLKRKGIKQQIKGHVVRGQSLKIKSSRQFFTSLQHTTNT